VNDFKNNNIIQIFIMALSCEKLKKAENEEEMTSATMGYPVAFVLFVIVVIIMLLWTFFPSIFIMVVVFLGSLVVAYNNHAVQEGVGKEI
jgi:uncharacterized BrkB/YihY/UPF0761 family membrane protein